MNFIALILLKSIFVLKKKTSNIFFLYRLLLVPKKQNYIKQYFINRCCFFISCEVKCTVLKIADYFVTYLLSANTEIMIFFFN